MRTTQKTLSAALLAIALSACGGGAGDEGPSLGGGGSALTVGDIYIVDTNDNDIYADAPLEQAFVWDRDTLGKPDLTLFWEAVGTKTSSGGYLAKWFLSTDQVLDEGVAGVAGRPDQKLLQVACNMGTVSVCESTFASMDCNYESGTLKCETFPLADMNSYFNNTLGAQGDYFLILKLEDGLTSQSRTVSFPVTFI